jgi:hypothetical protein
MKAVVLHVVVNIVSSSKFHQAKWSMKVKSPVVVPSVESWNSEIAEGETETGQGALVV